MRIFYATIFISIALVAIGGCKRKTPDGMPDLIPCSIVIQQEGAPLASAKVSLEPENGGKWNASGLSDKSGRVVFHTWGLHKGAAEGTYKVTVFKEETIPGPPAPPNDPNPKNLDKSFHLVEPDYGDLAKTPLTLEVRKPYKEQTLDVGKAVRIEIPALTR